MADKQQLDIEQAINAAIRERAALQAANAEQLANQVQLAMDLCKSLKCEDLEGVGDRLATMRESLDNYGHQDKVLVPHAFPPPFNVMSGLDYAQVASLADHIPVKLYTMHWAMIARFYLDQISRCNPHLGESLLVDGVFKLLDISDSPPPPRIEDVRYPGPHDRHFESRNSQLHKLTNAQRAAGSTPIAALVHGYGPVMDMIKRFQIGMEGTDNRVWINRYGYLSDDKLSKIGETVRVLARGDQ